MIRSISLLVLVGLFAAVLANPAAAGPQDKDAQPRKEPFNPATSPQIIALTVSATPAPVPSLKYELLPPTRARVPGNAAVDYLRATLLIPPWPHDAKEGQKLNDDIDRWVTAPLDAFPAAEAAPYLKKLEPMFRALDRAARAERCEWQLGPYLSHEQLEGLLTESQKFRELTRFNTLRLKAHLASNDLDAALRDLQAGFRLARDVGESPTTIRMLIGIALTAIATGGAEQWVGRPGAPNLYWALEALPKPFIDPRPALDGEAAFVRGAIPEPDDLLRGPISAEHAEKLLGEMLCAIPGGCPPPTGFVGRLAHRAALAEFASKAAPLARADLVNLGKTPEEISALPDAQAVALRSILTIRALRDDLARAFTLPHPRAMAELKKLADRCDQLKVTGDPFLIRYALGQAGLEKVYYSYARIGRRLAGLQAVEAVRLHAAENGGKVPAQLADVTVVRVPDDPQTGKPFEYAATPDGFTLSAMPTDGQTPHAANSFRYEVKVRMP